MGINRQHKKDCFSRWLACCVALILIFGGLTTQERDAEGSSGGKGVNDKVLSVFSLGNFPFPVEVRGRSPEHGRLIKE